jgi:hypothetical protein
MKIQRIVSPPMRLQNFPALCIAILATHAACVAAPAPAESPDALPDFRTTPAKTPAKDTDKALPLGAPAPSAPPLPTLLPDEIPRTLRPGTGNAPARGKPASGSKPNVTAEEIDLRVRYRKARNMAEGNEKVRSAWEYSRYPKTDEEKRQALRRYYDLLFSQMVALDRGIAPLVEKTRKAETAALTQTKIAPTVPNE